MFFLIYDFLFSGHSVLPFYMSSYYILSFLLLYDGGGNTNLKFVILNNSHMTVKA